jgi:hypothetical protein
MIQQLAIHANAGFQHILTGDESRIVYDDMSPRMCTIARSDIDSIARPTSYPRETMMTIFFGFNSIALINI